MKKILLYNSDGGLGYAIQLFPMILSLKDHFKSVNFFYLYSHENISSNISNTVSVVCHNIYQKIN